MQLLDVRYIRFTKRFSLPLGYPETVTPREERKKANKQRGCNVTTQRGSRIGKSVQKGYMWLYVVPKSKLFKKKYHRLICSKEFIRLVLFVFNFIIIQTLCC